MSRDRALGALRYKSEFCENALEIHHLDCTACLCCVREAERERERDAVRSSPESVSALW